MKRILALLFWIGACAHTPEGPSASSGKSHPLDISHLLKKPAEAPPPVSKTKVVDSCERDEEDPFDSTKKTTKVFYKGDKEYDRCLSAFGSRQGQGVRYQIAP